MIPYFGAHLIGNYQAAAQDLFLVSSTARRWLESGARPESDRLRQ
jgi:hypothetical protein